MTYAELAALLRQRALSVRGCFHCTKDDAAPVGAQSVVMVGPDEPWFWDVFRSSPEFLDGTPNPLDRWSKRMGDEVAFACKGTAVFPYDGPPYPPFLKWAERTGESFSSPVGLLVHNEAGLFISFRFALALPYKIDLPKNATTPCNSCEKKPCLTACPVGALSAHAPCDVPKCKAHIRSENGVECRQGCLVRRACPVSQRFGRRPEQSAFHMRAFLGE